MKKQRYTYDEINSIVNNYLNNIISEEEMIGFLNDIYNNSLTDLETLYLTDVMVKSGNIIDLSKLNGIKVDKHSTGGVGDKTTLIIGSIIAANAVYYPKMSGKSLGHTGGTIDKLLSIPRFRVDLNEKEFINNLNKNHISIISQSDSIVPADKKIYDLRNKSNTVMSIPLIASSVMSKKIACNSDKILIDVKCGKGALLQTEREALELSKLLCKIGKAYNKETICIITNMDYPLGNMVGNSLEIKEVINILKGEGNKELRDLCIYLSSYLLSVAKGISLEESINLSINTLDSGEAHNKFLDFVKEQGGDLNQLNISNNIVELRSKRKGYITDIDAFRVGTIVSKMSIDGDYSVGVELIKKVGDYVNEGDLIGYVYSNELYNDDILDTYEISDIKKEYKMIKYVVKY